MFQCPLWGILFRQLLTHHGQSLYQCFLCRRNLCMGASLLVFVVCLDSCMCGHCKKLLLSNMIGSIMVCDCSCVCFFLLWIDFYLFSIHKHCQDALPWWGLSTQSDLMMVLSMSFVICWSPQKSKILLTSTMTIWLYQPGISYECASLHPCKKAQR